MVDYSKESSGGNVATFSPKNTSVGIPQSFSIYVAAVEGASQLIVIDNATGRSYSLNLPGAYQAAINPGGTIALAMVRNSNTLYRVLKLNSNQLRPLAPSTASPTFFPSTASCLYLTAPRPLPSIVPSAPTSRSTAAPSTFSTAVLSAEAQPPALASSRPVFSTSRNSHVGSLHLTGHRQHTRPGRCHGSAFRRNYSVRLGSSSSNPTDSSPLPLHHLDRYKLRHRQVLHLRRQPQQDALRRRQHPLDRLPVLRQRRASQARPEL